MLPGNSITLRGDAAPGSTVRIQVNQKTVAAAVAGDTAKWRTHIGFNAPGDYGVQAVLIDEDQNTIAASEIITITVLEPTPTPVPPTETPTPAPTATATDTPEPTATATAVPPTEMPTTVPTATATNSPEPTATNTAVPEAVAPVIDAASLPTEVLPGESITLRGLAAAGDKVQILANDKRLTTLLVGDTGRWRTHIGFGQPGAYAVVAQTVDDNDVVILASAPITVTVLEPLPTATPTAAPAQPAAAAAEPTPDALPATGAALDQRLLYNLLLPLLIIAALGASTLFRRRQDDAA